MAGLSLPTIQRMEASEGVIRGNVDSLVKLIEALDAAGLELIGEGAVSQGNGRGVRLFGQADHDAACIGAALGAIPLAGFFAQGELGPVGGQNFMHGFTASVAIFEGKCNSHFNR